MKNVKSLEYTSWHILAPGRTDLVVLCLLVFQYVSQLSTCYNQLKRLIFTHSWAIVSLRSPRLFGSIDFWACSRAAHHGWQCVMEQSGSLHSWDLKRRKGLGFQYHLQRYTPMTEDLFLGPTP